MLNEFVRFYPTLQIPDGVPCGWLWEEVLLAYGEAAAVAAAHIAAGPPSNDKAAETLRQGLIDMAQAGGNVAVLLVNSPSRTVMHLAQNLLVLPAILLAYHSVTEDPVLLEGLRRYVDRLCEVVHQLPDDSHSTHHVLAACRQARAWYMGIVGMDEWLGELCDRLHDHPPTSHRGRYAWGRVNMGYPEFFPGPTWYLPPRYRWPGEHIRFQNWVTHTVTKASREEDFYDIVYQNGTRSESRPSGVGHGTDN